MGTRRACRGWGMLGAQGDRGPCAGGRQAMYRLYSPVHSVPRAHSGLIPGHVRGMCAVHLQSTSRVHLRIYPLPRGPQGPAVALAPKKGTVAGDDRVSPRRGHPCQRGEAMYRGRGRARGKTRGVGVGVVRHSQPSASHSALSLAASFQPRCCLPPLLLHSLLGADFTVLCLYPRHDLPNPKPNPDSTHELSMGP